MEAKKTERADLTKKTFLFFNIGLIVALSLAILAFGYRQVEDTTAKDLTASAGGDEEVFEVPQTEINTPPPPQIQQPVIVEVPDEKEIEEDLDINMDTEVQEDTKIEAVEIKPQVEEEKEDPNQIFLVVEETAAPVGGMSAFYEFVGKKMKYPAQARRMGIEGKVFVQFVVERDGSITDVQAIKKIGAGCDEEAERVVASAPKWKPGKQRGKPVRQKMVIPINFKLGG